MTRYKTNKQLLVLYFVFLVICLLGNLFFAYRGHYGYDDMGYALHAVQIIDPNQNLNFQEHFAYRWGLIIPLAISFKLFGINDHAAALPALCTLWSILFLIAYYFRKSPYKYGIFAMTVIAFNRSIFNFSDKIMPDLMVALSVTAAFLILYGYRYGKHLKNKYILSSILMTLALFFGFISKGTIVLILPVLFYIFIIDLIHKRYLPFWLWSIGIACLIFLLYFSCVYFLTGQYNSRFSAISHNAYVNACSYHLQSWKVLFKRLTYELLLVFGNSAALWFLGLGIFAFFNRHIPFKNFWSISQKEAYWPAIVILAILSANFMSISYQHYLPMCAEFRHFFYLVPLIILLITPVFFNYLNHKTHKTGIVLMTTLVCFFVWYHKMKTPLYFYLLILGWVIVRYTLAKSLYKKVSTILFILMLLLLSVSPIKRAMYVSKTGNYAAHKKVVTHFFKSNKEVSLVITNTVQRNMAKYFLEYNPSHPVRFIDYKETETFPVDSLNNYTEIYVLMNWFTRQQSFTKWEQLPSYCQQIPENFELRYDENGIQLYKVNDKNTLLMK